LKNALASQALNFFSFDMYQNAFARLSGKYGNVERFAAGASAGVTATLVCFPLDVLRTRVMAGGGIPPGGIFKMLFNMARHEGIGSLYAGG
jgi:hypothetical protein